MALADKELWQKFVTQLANFVTPGIDEQNQVICFSGTTLMIDLVNTDSKITNSTIFKVGNVIPKWSSVYVPNSGLIGSYASFLNWIDLGGDPNPNLDAQIDKAREKIEKEDKRFSEELDKAIEKWKKMAEVMPDLTWPEYRRKYGAALIAAKDALDAAAEEHRKLLREKGGKDYRTLLEAQRRVRIEGGARDQDRKNKYNMHVGENMFVAAYNLDPAFKTAYREWQTKSVHNQVDVGPIEVTGTTKASDSITNASSFGNFFSFFGAGSASARGIKSSWHSTNFNLKVYFTGLQTFKIGPRRWLQRSLIQNYKDKLYPNAPNFFGENGSLSLLPYQLIIGFEPKLELTLDNVDYQEVKTSFQDQASASIGMGPFRIEKALFSTPGSKDEVSYNDESLTITMGPIKSTLPLLLGVICSKL